MTDFHVVIPARYQSSRLPGKPLIDIGGKPMIQWVVEAAISSGAKSVAVATDDSRIFSAVQLTGARAIMTSSDHQSGSDRIAEACEKLQLSDQATVVNVQGDEPLMPPALIRQVASLLDDQPDAVMATLCTALDHQDQFIDPAVVKVVTGAADTALYFSRAPIPWVRNDGSSSLATSAFSSASRHLGIYACSSAYIRQFASRPPCPLEQLERLEQLRVLWHGEIIACTRALEIPPAGVDNEDDLQRVRRLIDTSL